MGDVFSTGKSAQKRAQRQQEANIAKQKQVESARLAEEEGEIARRKATQAPGRGGRSLLIQTSQTGTRATTLGGGA